MIGSPRHRITRKSSAFVALATASILMVPMSQVAHAVIPSGGFLNPSATGPNTVISDKADGTDGTYHIVLRVNSNDGGQAISSVALQIEDGDADAAFESIGSATQVGSSDTWTFAWDIGAHTPAADVDNDAGTLRAVVTDAGTETANVDVAVTFLDSAGETVEITSVANGGNLGFFDPDGGGGALGATTISGTGSSGVNAAGEVDLYYSKSPNTGNPTWILCGETAGVVTAPATTATWSGTCTLTGADTGDLVTAVAARADTAAEDDTAAATESGDAHRVSGYVQAAAGSTITITPTSDTQTVGFCNTYTVRVLDIQGAPILNANVDVHAVGPNDNLQFAWNADETGADDVSDNGTTSHAPDAADHGGFQAIAECDATVDAAFAETADADTVRDNKVGDDASDGTPAAGERGAQGNHVDAGNDIKHFEGQTDGDGFQFSIDSDAAGSTSLTTWFDSNGDELVTGGGSEPSTSASKTWVAATTANVDGTPETDVNLAGDPHTFTCVVTDAQGNPRSGETCRFNVVSGPDADDNNDAAVNGSPGDVADAAGTNTPAGYIGECTTDAAGTCDQIFSAANQGSEVGTDVVDIFVNSAGEVGNALFVADADDPKDPGGVSKQYTPANGGGATCIDVDPNTETVGVTGTQVFTVFVTTGTFDAAGDAADTAGQTASDCSGSAVAGIAIDLTVGSELPDASLTPDTDANENVERVVTDAAGSATVTMDNDDDAAGDNTLTAAEPGSANPAGDFDGTVTWAAAGTATAINCEPEDSVNADGSSRSIMMTVTDAFGTPVSGVNLDAFIRSGPNASRDVDSNPNTAAGYIGEGTSNAAGQVSVSYTGIANDAVNGGNDLIDCIIDVGDDDTETDPLEPAATAAPAGIENAEDQTTDSGDPSDYIDALWRASATIAAANVEMDLVTATADYAPGTTPPTPNCGGALDANYGGATWENTDTDDVNNIHLVCVSVVQAGAGDQPELVGTNVTLTSTGVGVITDNNGPPPSLTSQTAAVESDGYARFWIYSTQVGTQNLVASATGVTDTDSGTKTWNAIAASEARIIDCEPESQTRTVNTQATVTCDVTDGFSNPVQGVAVTFQRVDSGGAASTVTTQQTTSDANGEVFITLNSVTAGGTAVTGQLSSATTECEELAGAGQGGNDTGKPAGACSDSVDIVWQAVPPKCPGYESTPGNHVVGTSAGETLTGTNGDDVICGLGGDDTLIGLDGDDILVGGSGDDQLRGGNGNDTLLGDNGEDILHGGVGADSLEGGDDDDSLYGGSANDDMDGDAGDDRLFGGAGDDQMVGGTGADRLEGDNGDDELRGGAGVDVILGEDGDDVLHGGGGRDSLEGGDDDDVIRAIDGRADTVRGGAGRPDHCYIDRRLDDVAGCERTHT